MLTQTRLRELYNYDPLTGVFSRRVASCYQNERFVEKSVTTKNKDGYIIVTVEGEVLRAARLAVLYMTGEWPKEHVDHINGTRNDDRWCNLREATRSENMRNTATRSNNTSGVRGVSWNKRRCQWHARVNVNGTLHHCGYFNSLEEAKAARDAKAFQLHGAFARFDSLIPNAKEQTQ